MPKIKTKRIQIRIEEGDKRQLQRAAKKAKKTLSDFMLESTARRAGVTLKHSLNGNQSKSV